MPSVFLRIETDFADANHDISHATFGVAKIESWPGSLGPFLFCQSPEVSLICPVFQDEIARNPSGLRILLRVVKYQLFFKARWLHRPGLLSLLKQSFIRLKFR